MVPGTQIPPYRPAELVRDLEQFLCQNSGFPRRNFLFLCSSAAGRLTPTQSAVEGMLEVSIFVGRSSERQEILLAHTLDVGYRSGERVLSFFLQEAVSTLGSFLETASRLFAEMQRIEFTDEVCPLDGNTDFCP